jgi:hypothetical protein
MSEVIRITTIRKDQNCCGCNKIIPKGSKVIVRIPVNGRTIKRNYYCNECEPIRKEI